MAEGPWRSSRGTQQTGAAACKRGDEAAAVPGRAETAVPDVNVSVDMTYLGPRLWRFKDTSHYGFVTKP